MRRLVALVPVLLAVLSTFAAKPAEKLLKRLHMLEKRGIMFGHQDGPLYGVNWKYEEGRSDVKETCGDYPAVMGFELGGIELGRAESLDGVPFDLIRKEIIAHHERGGIITLSWHPWNPATGGNAWDVNGHPVKKILPDGELRMRFDGWLAIISAFLKSLKTNRGKDVPVIFRPWHEMSGGWFWWGKDSCTPDEYKHLFQYTIDALHDMGVKNIVTCYSPGGVDHESEENFLRFYPGDEYVDMLGIDIYQYKTTADYIAQVREALDVMQQISSKRGKLIALTETGYQNTPQADWFTSGMWEAVKNARISYVLLWRNAWDKPKENFGPAPDKATAADFRKLYAEPRCLFLKYID